MAPRNDDEMSCKPVIFGKPKDKEELNNQEQKSFEKNDSSNTNTEGSTDHEPLQQTHSYSSRIHDPIYEEVFEDFEEEELLISQAPEASAPLYENLKDTNPRSDVTNRDTVVDFTTKPEEVKQKLLDNQAHIDDLMGQLNKKIIKRQSIDALATNDGCAFEEH